MAIEKRVASFDEAVADVQDGAAIHLGGFGGPGECPSYLIAALARRGAKGLTLHCNLSGWGTKGIDQLRNVMKGTLPIPDDFYDAGLLVEQGLVRKGVFSFPAAPGHGELPFERELRAGRVELELIGQGSLAERIRAAKGGIAAFYTPTGVGTVVAEGKEVREFDGRAYLLERALPADFAFIRAHRADPRGNLVYRGTQRTMNATMAGAARITIAEVDEVVPLGALDPDAIVTPGLYVQRIVVRPPAVKHWTEAC
jgi:3-oxoadipate CoA-transferase alpha subunit